MILTAWRIFKPKHAQVAFSGEGARLYGGRWNSPGIGVVYTAETASLATLEMLVHLNSHQVLQTYHLCAVTFEDALVEELDRSALPPKWRSNPAPQKLRQIGDAWFKRLSSAVLRVPSAIIETELNYLLNPNHPDFTKLEIGEATEFFFDSRFVK